MTGEDIAFLSVEDVIAIHEAVISAFSPTEPRDLLNPALLESAVLAPQQTFGGEYLHQSLEEIAAAISSAWGITTRSARATNASPWQRRQSSSVATATT